MVRLSFKWFVLHSKCLGRSEVKKCIGRSFGRWLECIWCIVWSYFITYGAFYMKLLCSLMVRGTARQLSSRRCCCRYSAPQESWQSTLGKGSIYTKIYDKTKLWPTGWCSFACCDYGVGWWCCVLVIHFFCIILTSYWLYGFLVVSVLIGFPGFPLLEQ